VRPPIGRHVIELALYNKE
jgi:secreted Zn-dependent insulinase-like peptidase